MKKSLTILFIYVSGILYAQTPKFSISEDIESQVSNSVNIYYAPNNVTPTYTNVSPNISIEFDSSFDGVQKKAFTKAVQIWEQFLLSMRTIANNANIIMPTIRLKVQSNLSASNIVSSKMMTVTDFSNLIDYYYFHNIASSAWYTTVGAKLMVAKWNWDNINDALKNEPDITLSFNTNKDLYYFGTNGSVPSDKYDFVTIVLRELLKGSGFGSSATSKYGIIQFFKTNDVASCFDNRLYTLPNNQLYQLPNITVAAQSDNVYFGSGNFGSTKMYAPSTFSKGLSLIYIDTDNAGCILKKDLKKGEAIHVIGDDIKNIFRDLCLCDIITGNSSHTAPLNNAPYTLSCNSSVINPNQSYTVTASTSGSWEARLQKEDGSYYTYGTSSGSSISLPVNYFNNIPNNLSYSYELGGKVRGDILFTAPLGNVSYPIFISSKPPKPYFTVKEVVDVDEWVCDVVFELTSPNASSFRITHDCYDYGYSYDYTINDGSYIFTIHNVEKYFTNYFRLFAINSYGESSSTEVILDPVNLNIQTYSLNLTKSTDKIHLSLKTSYGNSKNITTDEIETLSIVRIDNLSKVNISKNSICLDSSIDISKLPAGVYAVQVVDKRGKVYREKFIR